LEDCQICRGDEHIRQNAYEVYGIWCTNILRVHPIGVNMCVGCIIRYTTPDTGYEDQVRGVRIDHSNDLGQQSG
jgi:hypothetical protein